MFVFFFTIGSWKLKAGNKKQEAKNHTSYILFPNVNTLTRSVFFYIASSSLKL